MLKLSTQEPMVVFLVDVSNSITDKFISNGLAWINRLTEERKRKDKEIILFADRPVSISSFEDETTVLNNVVGSTVAVFDRNTTDLERAVKSAIASFDRNRAKRLVILTDGNETVGNVWRNVEALKKENIKVHFMVPKGSGLNDAWVVSIDSPPRVRREEMFLLTVRVYSPIAEVADLEILADGIYRKKRIDLSQGVNNVDTRLRFRRKI